MNLIETIMEKTGEPKDYILECACPSNYGPEYDKYDNCKLSCKDCWQQEVILNAD